jgi:hypothetical protein
MYEPFTQPLPMFTPETSSRSGRRGGEDGSGGGAMFVTDDTGGIAAESQWQAISVRQGLDITDGNLSGKAYQSQATIDCLCAYLA